MGSADPRIGKPFPTAAFIQTEKPKFQRGALMRQKMPLTPVEKHAISEEEELTQSGFKGWTITVKYKDGHIDDIPLIAKSLDEAWSKAREKIKDPENVHEIVVVDPKIGEILHKIGSAAAGAARRIASGTMRIARGVRKAVVTGAHAAGRAIALPSEAKEAFQAGREERPPLEEPEPSVVTAPVERPLPPTTMEEWRGQSVPLYTRGTSAFEEPPSEVVHVAETGTTFVRRAKEKTSQEKSLEKEIALTKKEVTLGVLKRQKKRIQELEEEEKKTSRHGAFGKSPFGGKARSIHLKKAKADQRRKR